MGHLISRAHHTLIWSPVFRQTRKNTDNDYEPHCREMGISKHFGLGKWLAFPCIFTDAKPVLENMSPDNIHTVPDALCLCCHRKNFTLRGNAGVENGIPGTEMSLHSGGPPSWIDIQLLNSWEMGLTVLFSWEEVLNQGSWSPLRGKRLMYVVLVQLQH